MKSTFKVCNRYISFESLHTPKKKYMMRPVFSLGQNAILSIQHFLLILLIHVLCTPLTGNNFFSQKQHLHTSALLFMDSMQRTWRQCLLSLIFSVYLFFPPTHPAHRGSLGDWEWIRSTKHISVLFWVNCHLQFQCYNFKVQQRGNFAVFSAWDVKYLNTSPPPFVVHGCELYFLF
jgi:hypothetical protein